MIKISLILLCGLAAVALLNQRSAALRHWVLAAAILCAGATPLLEPIVPSWHVPLHPSLFGRTVEPLTLIIPVHITTAAEDLTAAPDSGFGQRMTAQRIFGWVWLTGAAISLSMLFIGLARLAGLAARSQHVVSGPWTEMAARLSRPHGLHRPVRLLRSDHPSLLVTWGLRQPTIILPRAARDWSEDRMRIVLGHELAHIRRHDWLMHLAAALLRAAYWFNPLVWIACRQLRHESEQACDDAVLGLGIEGPEYATHLLEVARAFKHSRITVFPAPAMARPSSLERRVRAMLNTHLVRTPLTRAASLVIAIALVAITIPLAGLVASAQSTTASFSGSLIDAVGRILPDTVLTLTNAQTNQQRDMKSDPTGHFAVTGLAAGDYLLNAKRAGFATSQGRVTLEAGQNLVRDVALQVGALQETIVITAGPGSSPAPPATPRPVKTPSQPEYDPCSQSPVGGCIMQPIKILDRKPIYPANQRDAGVSGRVEIDARIGADGLTKDFRLTEPAEPDFVSALIDAVRQWRFTQTRLDGVPVEVVMHVSARFVRE
jgi:beta-lactamase regulating signal transducer with metallopeptidase domain